MENKIEVVQKNATKIIENLAKQDVTESDIQEFVNRYSNILDIQLATHINKLKETFKIEDNEVVEGFIKEVTDMIDSVWTLSKFVAIRDLLTEENENETN